jgi:hypothetical protein
MQQSEPRAPNPHLLPEPSSRTGKPNLRARSRAACPGPLLETPEVLSTYTQSSGSLRADDRLLALRQQTPRPRHRADLYRGGERIPMPEEP